MSDDMDEALVLTDEQKKAFKALKTAFNKCGKAGLEIHGELETLYAINKHGINGRRILIGAGDDISQSAEFIAPKCFHGCSADDGLQFYD